MNPNIASLAKAPRGTAWHSRLVPFDHDIRRMRAAGETYGKIAAWISQEGLRITGAAVQGYVSVRARRGSCEYQLPVTPQLCTLAPNVGKNATPLMSLKTDDEEPQKTQTDTEEFVYRPPETKKNSLQDRDFNINNPLIYEPQERTINTTHYQDATLQPNE